MIDMRNHGKITLIDTGLNTMTGGGILDMQKDIMDNKKTFMLTYGDGVGYFDVNGSLKFHMSHKKYLTMTSVLPEGRFGALGINK